MNKVFKPILGIPNYFACNDGTIWKNCPHKGFYQRKPDLRRDGYIKCSISVNNKVHHYLAHRLIAFAFLPAPELGMEINHIDGNKQNNAVTNLEWTTRSKNIIHAHKYLDAPTGASRQNAKFSDDEVRLIRKMHKQGFSGMDIVRAFDRKIRNQTVYEIIHMQKYKYVV